jgi:hypothetical protein
MRAGQDKLTANFQRYRPDPLRNRQYRVSLSERDVRIGGKHVDRDLVIGDYSQAVYVVQDMANPPRLHTIGIGAEHGWVRKLGD